VAGRNKKFPYTRETQTHLIPVIKNSYELLFSRNGCRRVANKSVKVQQLGINIKKEHFMKEGTQNFSHLVQSCKRLCIQCKT
jgi:hypothetical protein